MDGVLLMDGLFAKTAKGYDEVDTKAGGLPPVLRRLLIFVNGKRTLKELATLPRVDDLKQALLELEQGGYITRVGAETASSPMPVTAPAPAPVAAPLAPPSDSTGFRPLPASANPLQIQQIRNFMANTLTAFVGSFGVTGLVGRLKQAETHAEFRSLFPEWETTIQGTREGRRELDKLKTELLKII